jgi:hypothetical protein
MRQLDDDLNNRKLKAIRIIASIREQAESGVLSSEHRYKIELANRKKGIAFVAHRDNDKLSTQKATQLPAILPIDRSTKIYDIWNLIPVERSRLSVVGGGGGQLKSNNNTNVIGSARSSGCDASSRLDDASPNPNANASGWHSLVSCVGFRLLNEEERRVCTPHTARFVNLEVLYASFFRLFFIYLLTLFIYFLSVANFSLSSLTHVNVLSACRIGFSCAFASHSLGDDNASWAYDVFSTDFVHDGMHHVSPMSRTNLRT